MPSVSEKQHNAMEAAAHGHSTLGIPESVGKEFVAADEKNEGPQTELDTARLIKDGKLPSPQKVGNMYLFDMRITGTGTAYRQKLDQYVYREPDNYLNDEFLARCNGLAVIWEHPEGNKLTSEEFTDRIIGAIMLPYIRNDEVWGIAKIYDETAAQAMLEGNLSTSPAVIFTNKSDNEEVILDDDDYSVLVEGIPAIIDHVAVCESGVWDKGDPPNGILINNDKVDTMNDEENKDVKADSEGGEGEEKKDVSLDERMLTLIEGISKRLEALEPKADSEEHKEESMDMPGDPLPSAQDAAADSDEEKKENSFADAQVALLKKQIADLERKMPRTRTADEYDKLAIAQSNAEAHYSAFGDSVSVCRPMDGETVTGYRKRMVKGLQKHSEKFGKVDVNAVSDEAMLSIIEEGVYADAMAAARMPTANGLPNGMPRAIKGQDEVGRPFVHYIGGEPLQVFAPFRQKPRNIVDLRRQETKH